VFPGDPRGEIRAQFHHMLHNFPPFCRIAVRSLMLVA
jgi:hypothetical protein